MSYIYIYVCVYVHVVYICTYTVICCIFLLIQPHCQNITRNANRVLQNKKSLALLYPCHCWLWKRNETNMEHNDIVINVRIYNNDMYSTWYTPRLTHPPSNVSSRQKRFMLTCCRTTAFSSTACLGGSNDELKQQVWVLINSDNQDTPKYNKGTLRKTQETSNQHSMQWKYHETRFSQGWEVLLCWLPCLFDSNRGVSTCSVSYVLTWDCLGVQTSQDVFLAGILLVKSPFGTGSRNHILVVSFDGIRMKVHIPAKVWITKLPHYI